MIKKENQKGRALLGFVLVAGLVSAMAGAAVSETIAGQSHGLQTGGAGGSDKPAVQTVTPPSSPADFVSLAKKLGPAVVNISIAQLRRTAQEDQGQFGADDPFDGFWQRFFGAPMPRSPQPESGLGSGFIIDRDGTILTNYHVVADAQRIVVKLSDGESFAARVLGMDQKTDIAIVKIDAGHELPAAVLGNSDRLEVGEWVVAIGNPFGLDHTVTSGIVSAKGRKIGTGPYDSFIQTDASINPGNSGGPLINMRGEVIGINTAIFSQSGGNIGIGFAIPTNLVKDLLPQLKDKGRVVRGYLGATIQVITPEIADSLGMKQPYGVLVAEVTKAGPAERAGIKPGDIIVEFDRRGIKDAAELPLRVAQIAPGTTTAVKILREGRDISFNVTIGEAKGAEVLASTDNSDLGMTAQTVTAEIAADLGLELAEGVVITGVKPDSRAEAAGLERGDVITQINRRPVRDLADYRRVLEGSDKAKPLLFLVHRGESNLFLALKR